MSSALSRIARTLFLTTALASAALANAADFVSIKGKSVNIREQPTTQSARVWELSRGYPLQVLKRQGDWLQVRDFEETLGWVYAPLTVKIAHRVVKVETANLRAGPGTNHKVLGKLVQGEILRTLARSGSWVKIERDGGQQGWVSANLAWGW